MKKGTKKTISTVVATASVLGAVQPAVFAATTNTAAATASAAVTKVETSISVYDFITAKVLIGKVPAGADKTNLTNRLNKVAPKIFTADYNAALSAINNVALKGYSFLYLVSNQSSIDAKLAAVKNPVSKIYLQNSFKAIKNKVFTKDFASALTAVTNAETAKTQSAKDAAQALVDVVANAANKAFLQARLDKVAVTPSVNVDDTVATLTADVTTFTAQVGTDQNVTYVAKDKDGKVVAGANVFVRADLGAGLPEATRFIEKTGVTDSEGKVTFSIARKDVGVDNLYSYVVGKPTIYNDKVAIVWQVGAALISVDAVQSQDLGSGTAKEYVVTAKKSDGTNYTGRLNMNIAGTVGAGNITVQRWSAATNSWVTATGSGTAQVNYTLTASDNGQVKFRLYNAIANLGTVTPTFFYDLEATGNNILNQGEPNVTAGTITYVEQAPVFKLTEADATDTIATAALAGSTKDQKKLSLEVVDQFGNPYRGTVQFNDYNDADGTVATTTRNGVYAIDYNQDGTIDAGAAANGTINFAISQNDTNNDSKVDVYLADGTAETTKLAVWVDKAGADHNNGGIDSDEVVATSKDITAAARALSSYKVTQVTTGTIPAAGTIRYKVEALDQFGDAFTNSGTNENVIVGLFNADGKEYERTVGAQADQPDTAANIFIDSDNDSTSTAFDSEVDTTALGAAANVQTAATNVGNLPFNIEVRNGEASTNFVVKVWSDTNANAAANNGEAVGTASFTTGVAQATGGAFQPVANIGAGTAVITNAATNTADTSITNPYAVVVGGDNTAQVALRLQDAQNNGYNGASSTAVEFTIKNDGANTIVVNDAAGVAHTISANSSETISMNSTVANNPDDVIFNIVGATGNNNLVTVTAKVNGTVADTQQLLFNPTVVTGLDDVFAGNYAAAASFVDQGTVVAKSLGTNADNTGIVVIKRADATYAAYTYKLNAGGGFTGGNTIQVGGLGTNESTFEANLTINDVVTITSTSAANDSTDFVVNISTNN